MKMTGRSAHDIKRVEAYLKEQQLFRNYNSRSDPVYTGQVLELDLSKVDPCISGPKRPHDRVLLSN
jgi:aconitate hydratase